MRSPYAYGEIVSIRCTLVGSASEHNYTWEAPDGSTSLERGMVVDTSTVAATLTFEAREEDNGVYTCNIDDVSQFPVSTTIIVGNAYPHCNMVL